MWYQKTPLCFILCEMDAENLMAQETHQDHNSIIYTRHMYVSVTSKKQPPPDIYYCTVIDLRNQRCDKAMIGQSLKIRWWQ